MKIDRFTSRVEWLVKPEGPRGLTPLHCPFQQSTHLLAHSRISGCLEFVKIISFKSGANNKTWQTKRNTKTKHIFGDSEMNKNQLIQTQKNIDDKDSGTGHFSDPELGLHASLALVYHFATIQNQFDSSCHSFDSRVGQMEL